VQTLLVGLVQSLGVGFAAGFVGAIPPGPVGLSVMRDASEGRVADAIRTGLGGATVDTVICAAVGVGAGPLLARLTSPAVRASLSVVYLLAGAAVLVRELLRAKGSTPAPPRARAVSYAQGLARAALNPALVANWAMLVAFLLANGLLAPRTSSTLPFAVGAGVGVAGWFTLLARALASPRPRWAIPWVRRATLVAALGVVATGGAGLVQALGRG
jgi:threonine/homoserine/homoserine lactone efflux protein